jgi:hypothetical protein
VIAETDAYRKKTKACEEETLDCLEKREANPKEVESVAELQEVPNKR